MAKLEISFESIEEFKKNMEEVEKSLKRINNELDLVIKKQDKIMCRPLPIDRSSPEKIFINVDPSNPPTTEKVIDKMTKQINQRYGLR